MRIQQMHGASLLVVLSLCGCKPTPGHGSGADTAAVSSSGPVATPKPRLTAMAMLPAFRAHLDSVAAHPSMMRSSMPSHQAKVRALVDAMHTDMTAAGMHTDAAYEALADSVVKGSAALGTASGPELNRLIAEHVDQLRRLTAVYETKAAAM